MSSLLRLLRRSLARRAEPVLIKIENHLERTGRWKTAQRMRYKQVIWQMIDCTKTCEAVLFLLENDMRHLEILQREAFLKAECQRITKTQLSEDDQEQLEAWYKELDELTRELWRTEREQYIYSLKVPNSPCGRALSTRWKHPEGRMTLNLRRDCAGRGGCCGRDCGCCERPRSKDRPYALGHCTAQCGCCIRARGFELITPEDQGLARAGFDRNNSSDPYAIGRVWDYIFGCELVEG
ncbi:hypothetical protein ASPTUDRAFT_931128 [Aspergillus tubingensis CBS 134.48]|uniref:Uncharacterized protein n=1 Tax=Aspergillus tubingensis (strain CBS 134.48) TaxID=767770 RepID=A0A1L9N0B3_ASPTC|nr:hypothetical protein ASPTUDRAFT_931128 [Aspergillus tubingensis CBS 134.48]